MASISSLILKHLDELHDDDFEEFKWSLTRNMAQGFTSIPRSKLDKAKRYTVVDLMVNQYGPTDAGSITVQVLKQRGQFQLARELEEKLKGQAQAADVGSASSSSTAGVSLNISAQGTSQVHAPVLSGGHYHGPVTMNFTS